jgi:hypothetical protein
MNDAEKILALMQALWPADCNRDPSAAKQLAEALAALGAG